MTQQRYNRSKNIKNPALTSIENLDKMNKFWKDIKYKKKWFKEKEILSRPIIIREIKVSKKYPDAKGIVMD